MVAASRLHAVPVVMAVLSSNICPMVANAQGPMHAAPSIAVQGEPFGVISLEVPLPPNVALDSVRVLVSDEEGRLLYPATSVRTVEVKDPAPPLPGRLRPGGLIDRVRSAIRTDSVRRVPVGVMITALFRGAGPLRVNLQGDIRQQLTVVPVEAVRVPPTVPGAPAQHTQRCWTNGGKTTTPRRNACGAVAITPCSCMII